MKKILFVVFGAMSIMACGNQTANVSDVKDSIENDTIEVVDSTLIDTINID